VRLSLYVNPLILVQVLGHACSEAQPVLAQHPLARILPADRGDGRHLRARVAAGDTLPRHHPRPGHPVAHLLPRVPVFESTRGPTRHPQG
jgi:hypothetical protein